MRLRLTLTNALLALMMILSLITSIRLYATDNRKPAEQFAKTYTIDKRRPEVFETIQLAESNDDAADYVADTAVPDAVAPANLVPSPRAPKASLRTKQIGAGRGDAGVRGCDWAVLVRAPNSDSRVCLQISVTVKGRSNSKTTSAFHIAGRAGGRAVSQVSARPLTPASCHRTAQKRAGRGDEGVGLVGNWKRTLSGGQRQA